jgi:hypothetical protein
MNTYLTYAPIAVIVVWLFIVAQSIKSINELRESFGLRKRFFLNPFSYSKILALRNSNPEFKASYQRYKKSSRKLIGIWLITLLLFLIVTFAVGVITADGP